MDPNLQLSSNNQDKPQSTANEVPKERPEVPQRIQAKVREWWAQTDNQVQRSNALWEAREAHKYLFPARFNVNDPRRGQTPFELRDGKDDRRVQVPYIYRDSLQSTAMTVPDDMTFVWSPVEQVKPPPAPQLALVPTMAMQAGMPPPPAGAIAPPISDNIDPQVEGFGQTLRIVELNLLEEIGWLRKIQAWVQDGGLFPASILKFGFRRDYRTNVLSETPCDKDEQDSIQRLESLMQRFTAKEFDENSTDYEDMLRLVTSLKSKAELKRWWGVYLQLIPMDAFGVSEDAADLVDIYDAPFMFHDALQTGEEILKNNPYVELPDGTTEGILEAELTQAVPWDQRNATTDPNSRNRISRHRQLTTPRATPANVASAQGQSVDPKKLKFMVREIWCKRDRTVYTVIKGINHFIKTWVPQKTSSRWYPFAYYAPGRVPGEVYGCSDLELKKDIQKRIHRKRSDEEKARWLSIRRYIYNKGLVDEKELSKVQDIPPGQFRGANFGAGVKLGDVVMPLEQPFNPVSFDTTVDERDKDMMGALPVQALGTTGVANFATEANLAAQGASIAVQFRQAQVRRETEGLLTCLAEILLQELTPDEARMIAGPFGVWPELYDEREAEAVMMEAKGRAAQTVAPQVMQQIIGERMIMQARGVAPAPLDPNELRMRVETLAAPVWQQEMLTRFGASEPMTREALFRRLKVKVKSSLTSSLDRGQRIQSLSLLAQSTMQLAQAAQMSAIPFNARAFLQIGAKLVGEDEQLDQIFPAVPPVPMAAQGALAGAAGAGAPAGAAGGPRDQGGVPQPGPEQKPANATTPEPG